MYINFSTFVRLYNEAEHEDDLDIYIAERGWQDWMGTEDNVEEVISLLQAIHRAVRSDFTQLRNMSKFSPVEMTQKYNIPSRTRQHWECGEREPADHVRKLLSYAIIMEVLNKEEYNDSDK